MTKKKAEARWQRDHLAIIKKMKDRGMSPAALAKESGVNRSTIKRIVDGDQVPSIVTYYQVKEALEK